MKTGDLVSSRGSDVYVIHVADPRRAFYVDRGDGPFVWCGLHGYAGARAIIMLRNGTFVQVNNRALVPFK